MECVKVASAGNDILICFDFYVCEDLQMLIATVKLKN